MFAASQFEKAVHPRSSIYLQCSGTQFVRGVILPSRCQRRLTQALTGPSLTAWGKVLLWEATHCSASHEIPSSLHNPKVLLRVHNRPRTVPTMSPSNPGYILISLFSILILSSHL